VIHCRTYAREDGQQHVYIIERNDCFFIVEDAEWWELPRVDGVDVVYAYYPTVFGGERFTNFYDADRRVRQLYPWVDQD